MSDVVDGLEGELRSNGISVESLDVGEEVDLSYLTAFPGVSVNHQEMGRACNTFIDRVEQDDWDARRVEATVLRSDDDVLGTWHIEPEWITGLVTYRLSEEDFSERVIETVSEQPPNFVEEEGEGEGEA